MWRRRAPPLRELRRAPVKRVAVERDHVVAEVPLDLDRLLDRPTEHVDIAAAVLPDRGVGAGVLGRRGVPDSRPVRHALDLAGLVRHYDHAMRIRPESVGEVVDVCVVVALVVARDDVPRCVATRGIDEPVGVAAAISKVAGEQLTEQLGILSRYVIAMAVALMAIEFGLPGGVLWFVPVVFFGFLTFTTTLGVAVGFADVLDVTAGQTAGVTSENSDEVDA